MTKHIMLILVSKRIAEAEQVQHVLTANGCIIKTRLGIHDASPELCSNCGLIILELIGSDKDRAKLAKELKAVKGVTVKLEKLSCK